MNNNNHLFKLWFKPLFFLMILTVFCYSTGNFIILAIIVPLVIIFLFYIKIIVTNRIEKFYKIGSLDGILKYYDRTMNTGRVPEEDFLRSHAKSIAMSLFGDFKGAQKEMDGHDMTYKIPLYQAMQLNAITINNYLQKKDLVFSLELAKQAKALSKVSKLAPGGASAEMAYSTYIEIGEILNGNLNTELISKLENKFTTVPFLIKIQIAWGLGIAYLKLGRYEQLRKKENYLKENAPNCTPLHIFQ